MENMSKTLKILRYSFYDVLRSRWTLIYVAFFLLSAGGLLYFSNNLSKAIVSLNNIIIAIIPLISIVFGTMYFYNSREFVELLLSQPVKRTSIFLGQYLGLSTSLALSYLVGLVVPFAYYGITQSGEIWDFVILLITGVLLTFIFTAIAFLVSILNEDRIKGFGLNILIWLLMAVVYDGLVLLLLSLFNEYPLQNTALGISLFNPVDLSRILVLLKLDISALMSYTGAVFNNFFGSTQGMIISFLALFLWVFAPTTIFLFASKRKDF